MPQKSRDGILFRKRQVDHRQDGPLAGKDASEEKRHHGVVDVLAVEMAGNGGAKSLQGRGEVGSLSGGGSAITEALVLGGGSSRDGQESSDAGAGQKRASFHPRFLPCNLGRTVGNDAKRVNIRPIGPRCGSAR